MSRELRVGGVSAVAERLEKWCTADVAVVWWIQVPPLDAVGAACDADAFRGRDVGALEERGGRDELEDARGGSARGRYFGAGLSSAALGPCKEPTRREIHREDGAGPGPRKLEQPFGVPLEAGVEGELSPSPGAKRRVDGSRRLTEPREVHVRHGLGTWLCLRPGRHPRAALGNGRPAGQDTSEN
jgi:hypothetical protein